MKLIKVLLLQIMYKLPWLYKLRQNPYVTVSFCCLNVSYILRRRYRPVEMRTYGLNINKIQQDATVRRYLFTAKLLYMFRVSVAPIIRST